jgi:hypothetical protein
MQLIDALLGIPSERSRQFRLLEDARKGFLKADGPKRAGVVHVEFVVPFVEGDYGLDAWIFFRKRSDVSLYAKDGTSDAIAKEWIAALEASSYPAEWISLVACRFSSKQEVDDDFDGEYRNYVR